MLIPSQPLYRHCLHSNNNFQDFDPLLPRKKGRKEGLIIQSVSALLLSPGYWFFQTQIDHYFWIEGKVKVKYIAVKGKLPSPSTFQMVASHAEILSTLQEGDDAKITQPV